MEDEMPTEMQRLLSVQAVMEVTRFYPPKMGDLTSTQRIFQPRVQRAILTQYSCEDMEYRQISTRSSQRAFMATLSSKRKISEHRRAMTVMVTMELYHREWNRFQRCAGLAMR